MINFRYHVVSLTAVFLALAIGLVVGTAAANGPMADSLNGQVNNIHKQNQQLRDQVDELNDEVNKLEEAFKTAAPQMLADRLSGRRVLVVAMPSSGKYVDGVQQMLTAGGAKVTGRLQLDDKFTDPTSNDQLLDLAISSAPPGVRGALPSRSNGVETSTALLAAVLVGGAAVEGAKTVLSAYQSQGYLSVSGEPGPAEAVVFLAGTPYTEQDATRRNVATTMIAERFDQAGRIVVATPAASGEGNVVRAVRDDPDLVKTASTVDNIATELGRIVVALALVEQFDGKVGHYGVGAGSSAPMPQLVGGRSGN